MPPGEGHVRAHRNRISKPIYKYKRFLTLYKVVDNQQGMLKTKEALKKEYAEKLGDMEIDALKQ